MSHGHMPAHLDQLLATVGHREVLQVQILAAHGPLVALHLRRRTRHSFCRPCLQPCSATVSVMTGDQYRLSFIVCCCLLLPALLTIEPMMLLPLGLCNTAHLRHLRLLPFVPL